MSKTLFQNAIKRFPDYKHFSMDTTVKLKLGDEITSVVGYIDIENGGVLLKKSLSKGESSSHLWYTSDLEIIKQPRINE
jgi:hypothetical protein